MKRWLQLVLASTPLLLLALPAPAGASSRFADIDFADQAQVVTLTLPAQTCRLDRAHVVSCDWTLVVNEPDAPGQPVVGFVSGSSGVLSVPYPASFCGRLQADALFGSPPRKMFGFRHEVRTGSCQCPSPGGQWPNVVTGTSPVHPHFPQGIYIAETGNTWTVWTTHRHSSGQVFTGTITTNGAFSQLTPLETEGHDQVTQVGPNVLHFRFVNRGYLDGLSFVSSTCASQVTFDTAINGPLAPPGEIFLGPSLTPASSSPVTFSR